MAVPPEQKVLTDPKTHMPDELPRAYDLTDARSYVAAQDQVIGSEEPGEGGRRGPGGPPY